MAPMYVYNCEACKHEQEELFSIKNRPDFITCQKCGGSAKHVLAPGQFEVKGANAANRYSGDSNYRWFGVGDKK
jgi:putative FmdB family regulatory protein